MREATAAAIPPSELQTVADLLAYRVKTAPHAVALLKPVVRAGNGVAGGSSAGAVGTGGAASTAGGEAAAGESGVLDGSSAGSEVEWVPVTTAEFEEDVMAMARGLAAALLSPGDSVAIMAPTSYEWFVAEMACAYDSLVVVPIYETSSLTQVRAILRDAGVRAAITATPELATLVNVAAIAENIQLKGVWTHDTAPRITLEEGASAATAGSSSTYIIGEASGSVKDSQLAAFTKEVNQRRAALTGDALATIVYTSGTTAAPKGVFLTHRDLVEKVRSVAAAFPEVVHSHGSTVILLPLSHILARGLQLCCLYAGMCISHVSNPKDALPALKTLKPTFLVMVPQVLQKIVSAVDEKAAQAHISFLWERAKSVAIRWGSYLEATQDDPTLRPLRWISLQNSLFDRIFYRLVRAQLGGNIDYLLSGAAPLEPHLNRLFLGMGIPIVEGYGLTESTAPLTANRVGDLRPGTVGTVLPGVTVRIADNGEVLVKGCGITSGYRNRALNEEAFTDGFFHTGDLGTLDERGHLVLQGRVKDLIVTSYGKTVHPTDWENEMEHHPLVSYAVMLGDNRKYVAGMVFVDVCTLTQWAAEHGTVIPAAARTVPAPGELTVIDVPEVTAALAPAVEHANALYSRAESVKRLVVVTADLAPGGVFVTPTMKLKRSKVLEAGAQIIDTLYAAPKQ